MRLLLPTDFGRESPRRAESGAAGDVVDQVLAAVLSSAKQTLVGRSYRRVVIGGV